MNGKEERKEIEARLHFAGITRWRLAWLDQLHVTEGVDHSSFSQSDLRPLLPLHLPLLALHNGLRTLLDAPGFWTLRGTCHEVHGRPHLFLSLPAVCS